MSDLTQGMEKEVLTPEQIKEQKAIAKAESTERGIAHLIEAQPLGEEITKFVELAKDWKEASAEERTEMRKNFKESFASKEELKAYVNDLVTAKIQEVEDMANALGTLKSGFAGIKRLGVAGKVRVSKKETQIIQIEGKSFSVRKVDIIESQSKPKEEKVAFLLGCEDTVEIEVVSFDAL